jgi:hypothetical protein
VSALAVLVRTEADVASERRDRALLETAPWPSDMRWVRRRAFRVQFSTEKDKTVVGLTPAGRVLHALYRARNDFLHGNEVDWATLVRWRRRREAPSASSPSVALPTAAAVLYRVALGAFLGSRYQFDHRVRGAEHDLLWERLDDWKCATALRTMLHGSPVADSDEA